jgi:hypothetical protein
MFQDWGGCVDSNGVATLRCLPIVFHNLVAAALTFVGATAVFLIIYSGIRLVMSGGDPKQVGAARQIMTYAIIGLIVVLGSFAIIYFISYLTNVSCITSFNFNCK